MRSQEERGKKASLPALVSLSHQWRGLFLKLPLLVTECSASAALPLPAPFHVKLSSFASPRRHRHRSRPRLAHHKLLPHPRVPAALTRLPPPRSPRPPPPPFEPTSRRLRPCRSGDEPLGEHRFRPSEFTALPLGVLLYYPSGSGPHRFPGRGGAEG